MRRRAGPTGPPGRIQPWGVGRRRTNDPVMGQGHGRRIMARGAAEPVGWPATYEGNLPRSGPTQAEPKPVHRGYQTGARRLTSASTTARRNLLTWGELHPSFGGRTRRTGPVRTSRRGRATELAVLGSGNLIERWYGPRPLSGRVTCLLINPARAWHRVVACSPRASRPPRSAVDSVDDDHRWVV